MGMDDHALPDVFAMLEDMEEERTCFLSPLEEVFSPRRTAAAAEFELESPSSRKRPRSGECAAGEGQGRMSHITVERNRRKQMNEHLSELKSLMPCFYVKRGDQASIIAGVVEYIRELQQVLQSLESKKQRKCYSDVLSPRPISSPKPPLPPSPRISLPPISPRTPQPSSPYKPLLASPAVAAEGAAELSANSRSPVANVEVKFVGPNVLLKTISPRLPGQALKIISALDRLALEILRVDINTVDDTLLNSFTIKIGIECELSADDLANEVQQTFS